MMPQKKNPDVPELVRGKAGRVAGHLMALLMTMKGLPLAYNKDLQEDKEALFDTVDTLTACLSIFSGLIATTQGEQSPYAPSCVSDDFSTATDIADYLAKQGLAVSPGSCRCGAS
jgi:argininosuccinate lyase